MDKERNTGASQDMQTSGGGESMSQEDIEAMMEGFMEMIKEIVPKNYLNF